jgi:hypothetical protein
LLSFFFHLLESINHAVKRILTELQRHVGSSEEDGDKRNVNSAVFSLPSFCILSSDNNVTCSRWLLYSQNLTKRYYIIGRDKN